jgi:hypothetical protein
MDASVPDELFPRISRSSICCEAETPFIVEHSSLKYEEEHMTVDARETNSLIGSDKVEGTSVFALNGERIGAIERVMIGKENGRVAYAVLSFGGILGIGEDHYPLPWSTLRYDSSLGGYRVDITTKQLAFAPKFRSESEWNWEQRGRAVDDYYGVPAIL